MAKGNFEVQRANQSQAQRRKMQAAAQSGQMRGPDGVVDLAMVKAMNDARPHLDQQILQSQAFICCCGNRMGAEGVIIFALQDAVTQDQHGRLTPARNLNSKLFCGEDCLMIEGDPPEGDVFAMRKVPLQENIWLDQKESIDVAEETEQA